MATTGRRPRRSSCSLLTPAYTCGVRSSRRGGPGAAGTWTYTSCDTHVRRCCWSVGSPRSTWRCSSATPTAAGS
jgi:hypothetical protein